MHPTRSACFDPLRFACSADQCSFVVAISAHLDPDGLLFSVWQSCCWCAVMGPLPKREEEDKQQEAASALQGKSGHGCPTESCSGGQPDCFDSTDPGAARMEPER